jgi:hypothetical protein
MSALRLLFAFRRFAITAGVVVLVVLIWLGARRAGRRGLEAAIPLWGAAIACFALAVFGQLPTLVDIALVLLSAALLVISVVALLMLGLAPRRRRVKLAKHAGPPWEDDKW